MTISIRLPNPSCQAVYDAPLRSTISFFQDTGAQGIYVFLVELIPFVKKDPEGTIIRAAVDCGLLVEQNHTGALKTPFQHIAAFIHDANDLVNVHFLQQLIPHFCTASSTALLYAMRAAGWRPDAPPENVKAFAHVHTSIRRPFAGTFRATTRSAP